MSNIHPTPERTTLDDAYSSFLYLIYRYAGASNIELQHDIETIVRENAQSLASLYIDLMKQGTGIPRQQLNNYRAAMKHAPDSVRRWFVETAERVDHEADDPHFV